MLHRGPVGSEDLVLIRMRGATCLLLLMWRNVWHVCVGGGGWRRTKSPNYDTSEPAGSQRDQE